MPPVEVFFCSTSERDGLADKMRKHWLGLGVTLRLLSPRKLGCSDFDFQRIRRAAADVLAKDSIYVLTDDDCEVTTDLLHGVRAMQQHDQFAIISAWPSNCTINRWTPHDYEPFEDLDVMEHVSVGGIRICRRGCMIKGWPIQTGKGYDHQHCEFLRNCGWRVGYSQHLRMIHHGEGKTTVWNKELAAK